MFDNQNFGELIVAAQSGSNEAIEQIIEMYMPLITKHSYIDGTLNEDLRQEIILKIITNISKFNF